MTIPQRLWPTIHTICSDMWQGYLTASDEFIAAHDDVAAHIVVDRFHVTKNYREDFDTLRKQELRRLRQNLSPETYQDLTHGMHWVLRRNHANLNEGDKVRLRSLFQYTPALHNAYTLREELTAIFNLDLNASDARSRLQTWAAKVTRSTLTCFDKFIKTLGNHLDWIANYFHRRANSGFVEGLNNKLKIITRRSYGLKRIDSLFRRLWLDLHGYSHFLA